MSDVPEGYRLVPVEPKHQGFAPCPYCRQYSHSIGEDRLAKAFMHFQSMYAHPVRGHPMGDNFDEQTQDAAQVLMAAAQPVFAGLSVKQAVLLWLGGTRDYLSPQTVAEIQRELQDDA